MLACLLKMVSPHDSLAVRKFSTDRLLTVPAGSGGYLVDLEIIGGLYGMNIGNQQFTMRGIKISKAQVS